MEENWMPIDSAPLAEWGLAWHIGWRRPFPAMRNGDNGAVWVDTCEPDAKGWQGYASHWMPLPEPPKGIDYANTA